MIAVAVVVAAWGIGPASAVHDDNLFELGGIQAANIVGDGVAANGPDWADIFNANGQDIGSGSFGGVAAAFIADPLAAKGAIDSTTFSGAGGSNKNPDPIGTLDCAARVPPLTGSACDTWHWDGGNVPAKDDLSNVYAYGKFASDGDLILYAGFERLAPEGDSHIDIEFLQNSVALDEAVPCNDPGNDPTPCGFTGIRTVGDLVISMDYLNGGAIGSISIHVWDGTDYVDAGALGGEGCNGDDTICAFNNGASINGGPWPNFERGGAAITDLPAQSFTEFGINLTEVLDETPCLSTFMGKTRSSQSFTAELKDFAGPASFNICGAQIGIATDDVNEVGDPHTFTVTASKKLGQTTSPADDGTIVDVTLTDSNGADAEVSSNTCANPGTVNGTCTITFTSDTPGIVTGHAAADIDVAGHAFHVETDGLGSNSDDAVKRFVDAFITIGPDDTNSIGESHTFTVTVKQNDGSGGTQPQNAPNGTVVTVTLTGDADSVVNTCASPGTSSGTCTVTFTSDTVGTVVAHASVTLTLATLSVTRATDGTGNNSGDATKTFVAGSIVWTKVDNAGALQGGATFQVCRTHTLNTGTGVFVDTTDACFSVVDNSAPDTDADNGEFRVAGLPLGRYTVKETAAPPGFEPDPDTVTVELTIANPNATIAQAFVNNRPIVKITGFGYTNAPTGTPTHGVTDGTTVFTANVKNFGGANANVSGTITVTHNAASGTVVCTPVSPVAFSDTSLVPNTETLTGSISCTYSGVNDGTVITATLNVSYTLNGLTRVASGSPATISFTVQSD